MAVDCDLEPEGFQLPDEPLRLRLDTTPLEDVLSEIHIARAP